MDGHLKEGEVGITYIDYTREHAVDYRHDSSVQVISFCPWCGSKLPDGLRAKWGETLESLEIFDPYGDDREKVPNEFWTEQWWIERGL
jgi:hypothetical protein